MFLTANSVPPLRAQIVDNLLEFIGSLNHLGVELIGPLRLDYTHHLIGEIHCRLFQAALDQLPGAIAVGLGGSGGIGQRKTAAAGGLKPICVVIFL